MLLFEYLKRTNRCVLNIAVWTSNRFPVLAPAILIAHLTAQAQTCETTADSPKGPDAPTEADYYSLQTIDFPEELKLEVGGLAWTPDGSLGIAIRKGEIWILDDPLSANPSEYRRFAEGLHEPLGLAWKDGAFYTVQRTELTRIADTDGDGMADLYRTVAKGWGVSGNYHEYAYGPEFDPEGNAWITLNCSIGKGLNSQRNWRGWSLKVAQDGNWTPVSAGFRSPSGIGSNLEGDIFVSDQQGNWFPTCPIIHVREGAFHGHRDALEFCELPGSTLKPKAPLQSNILLPEAYKKNPAFQPPAVWLPYRKMGMSATDILCDTTEGKFGPFAGQLFVGEFTMSMVTRVFLEKINGHYQGACFRFREGLQSAVMRLEWGQDGSMYIGQTNRGWNSLGTASYGLQHLTWTGKTPFEIQKMELQPDGFLLTFTQPADPESITLKGEEAIEMISYTYEYHQDYGSEEKDTQTLNIEKAELDTTGQRLKLQIRPLKEGYVHELSMPGLKSAEGLPLLHSEAFYTLNHTSTELEQKLLHR